MSIEACNCAGQPVIDADGSESLPLISAALGLDLDADRRVAPASFTSERMCAEGYRPAGSPGWRSREELGIASGRGRDQRLCVLARHIAFEKREADGRQSSAPAD